MKITIKIITGIFILGLAATTVMAQHSLSIEEGRMNDLLTVRLNGLDNQYTTLDVMGVDGKTWMTKHIYKQDKYVAGLDLSLLPDGDYLITTHNRGGRKVKAFNWTGRDITLFHLKSIQPAEMPKRELISYRTSEEGQLIVRIDQPQDVRAIDLQLANLREKKTVIQLTSLTGIPVFSKSVQTHGYAGRLSLDNVGSGDYVLCIQTPDVSMLQFLSIDGDHVTLQQILSREKTTGKGILVAIRP